MTDPLLNNSWRCDGKYLVIPEWVSKGIKESRIYIQPDSSAIVRNGTTDTKNLPVGGILVNDNGRLIVMNEAEFGTYVSLAQK